MDLKSWVIELRRDFHKHPETGWNEVRTSARVERELKDLGIEVKRPVGTSVVGVLKGAKPGKTIGLRADMDALEVPEKSTKPYASTNPGIMHACGHDAHTASLLGAARVLAGMKDSLKGTVVFLFQPAEEGGGGAKGMALAGAMEGVDAVFGTHVFGVVPAGKVAIHAGPMLAGSGSFKVTFHGKGGHGAQPHMSIDTITPACMAFMGIQGIVNKEIPASDAAVVNVCQIHGGTRGNVITDTCWLEGTFRYYKPELGDIISQAIQRIADAAAQATRTTVDVECRIGVGPTVNDAALAELAKEVAAKEIGPDAAMEFEPIMGSEDFSVFSNMVPGMFVGIGAGSPKDGIMWPNHHPLFDIDEDCLDVAVRMYVGFAKAYLEK